MKRTTALTALALVLGVALAGSLYAEGDSDYGYGYGPGMMGPGMMGPYGGYGHGPGMMGYGPGYGHGPGMMGYGPYGAYQHGPGMMGYGHGPGMMGYGPGYGRGHGRGGWTSEGTSKWLDDLKSELEIADTQAASWKSFADAVTAQAKAHQEHFKAMQQLWSSTAGNAPDWEDRHNKLMEQRLADQKAYGKALHDLYGALTDEQKARADEVLGGRGTMY